MSEQPLRVLLVDDETSLREPLAKRLRDAHGYHVDTAADAAGAWRVVTEAEKPYDVALIDDLLIPEPGAEPEPIGIRVEYTHILTAPHVVTEMAGSVQMTKALAFWAVKGVTSIGGSQYDSPHRGSAASGSRSGIPARPRVVTARPA